MDQNTFDLAKLPPERTCISSKWVSVWKQNQVGEGVRGKVRVVAKEFYKRIERNFSKRLVPHLSHRVSGLLQSLPYNAIGC